VARADSAPMIGPKKIEVNIWSDQLTGDFESSILSWSDQIQGLKNERCRHKNPHHPNAQETTW
jgi:hypothetical protein